ncbi:LysR family transcriptional regulator [Labrenzia sp. PHM005]|uniref:LysR family transcriptional regulator n=1 Tax=Labrenzia sp. PHM005 TaxID=2590016 RepID=UPI0011405A64|nr:LysR family transcriptional regulator [Labrenzia sp. PHM005]QDG74646.1 LysR family transcriptional regulator [Labrenzia sp. PHM005]
MPNLDHLDVIDTICETGSFQLASEKLNKARSAVSYSVKQVEDFYQIQIFDRSKYRPELTPEGRILLSRIRILLGQAQAFDAFVEELKGETETELALGVSSIFPTKQLTGLLKSLRSNFPATSIHLEFEVASGERMLLAEKVDVAVFAAPVRNASLDYKPIDTIDVPLLISRELINEQPDAITRTDLIRHPQVVVKSSDDKSPDAGLLDEAQKWYVTDLSAKKDLICSGLGWGRVPRHMVEEEINSDRLVVLPTLGEVVLPICLSKRANQSLGPVGQHIWNFFDVQAASLQQNDND